MKISKIIMAAALMLGMTACSQDEPEVKPGDDGPSSSGFYSKIRIALPTARSAASEGTEAGQPNENKIGTVLLVLSTKTDNGKYIYLTHAYSSPGSPTNAPTGDNEYSIMFTDTETLIYNAGKTVYMFAYCNPNANIMAYFDNAKAQVAGNASAQVEFVDEVLSSNVSSAWTPNGFLMTNVGICSNTLPDAEALKACNTPEKAYNLTKQGEASNPIQVMRAASRFDFRDASDNNDFTYSIVNTSATGSPEMGKVVLRSMAMFNMRGETFYLPRNSVDDTQTLCPGTAGMEQGFILSPTACNISYALPAALNHDKKGNVEGGDGLEWMDMTAWAAGLEDIDNGWGESITPTTDKQGYRIWRYTSENTFLGTAAPDPAKATGYVFEAEIIPAEITDETLKTAVNFTSGTDVMYNYKGQLFLNSKHIAAEVKNIPVSELANAYNSAFNTDGSPKSDQALADAGFVAYKPASDGKYYCYYFAYNRHNNDGKPYEYGPMEFAVVRNNVYKLAITNIKQFGTLVPPTEVEDWNVYFTLDIAVLDWTVRINNMEF